MDLSLVEAGIRLLITVEFAFLAVAGAAAAANCVAIDARLRSFAREQQQILDGIMEATEQKIAEKERKQEARLAMLREMMG